MEFRTRRFCCLGLRIFILRITMISSRRRGKATTLWHLPQKNDFFIPKTFFSKLSICHCLTYLVHSKVFFIVWPKIWICASSRRKIWLRLFGQKNIQSLKRVICQCKKKSRSLPLCKRKHFLFLLQQLQKEVISVQSPSFWAGFIVSLQYSSSFILHFPYLFRYDMPTITKMTPEDLTAIGVKKPNHRKKLKAEIVKLTFPDGLPNYIPPTLDEFLHLVRLTEYRGLLANQGYLTIDDLVQISIEDLEDIGIYRLGHQKRLLLAIKRAKDLKAGRRIAQYPQQQHVRQYPQPQQQSPLPPPHPPTLSLKQQPQPLQPQNLSSFQPQSLNNSRTNLTKVMEHPNKIYDRGLVYQPEVIRIERAPSVSSVVRPPSCSPSPPPPPPTTSEVLLPPMPEPMAPLSTSFQRYHPSFQYPQPPSWLNQNGINSGAATRSYDDVDIALSNRNPERRILMHQHSASNLTASGGTLPRLGKGFTMPTKQRPVAKIIAKTREQQQKQQNPLSDFDPKMNLQHPLKLSQNGGKTASDSQVKSL